MCVFVCIISNNINITISTLDGRPEVKRKVIRACIIKFIIIKQHPGVLDVRHPVLRHSGTLTEKSEIPKDRHLFDEKGISYAKYGCELCTTCTEGLK